ncbi:MAG: DUF2971 domain-containing protein [Rhodobacteraceae bacterium]|nr:DUF2971 domain-containing protein [Paracoccaceae bacterium]MYF46838.1 DUF2971 domain-containing protein [Paracoccaceae bacterium]
MPDIIYKYVSDRWALDWLRANENGALKVTQPTALNDPFELRVNYTINEDNPENTNEYWAGIISNIYPEDQVQVEPEEVEAVRVDYGTHFVSELIRRRLSMNIGVVSFSENHLHPLLWAHYANAGRGVVIGYNSQELDNGTLRNVEYNEMPSIIGRFYESHFIPLLYYKGPHWEYECEWRIWINLGDPNVQAEGDQDNEIYRTLIPNTAVRKVYCTEITPPDIVQEINQRLQNPEFRYDVPEVSILELSNEAYEYVERNAL